MRDIQIDSDLIRMAKPDGFDPVMVANLFGYDVIASQPLKGDRPTVVRHRATGFHINLDTLTVIQPDR